MDPNEEIGWLPSDEIDWLHCWKSRISHATGKVAYLKSALYRTAFHEVGHLLGLHHSGAYNAKGEYDQYGDAASVMGRFPADTFNAAQYHYKGWLRPGEFRQYDSEQKYYELKRTGYSDEAALMTLIIPPKVKGQDRVYVSYPSKCPNDITPCIGLYIGEKGGRGSKRIQVFSSGYYDKEFTGLTVKVLGKVDDRVQISVEQ